MGKKILLGYSGSWISGMREFYSKGKHKAAKAQPVYVSAKKYKKLKEWREMEYLSSYME